jgi:hypothetical protein
VTGEVRELLRRRLPVEHHELGHRSSTAGPAPLNESMSATRHHRAPGRITQPVEHELGRHRRIECSSRGIGQLRLSKEGKIGNRARFPAIDGCVNIRQHCAVAEHERREGEPGLRDTIERRECRGTR